MSVFDSEIDFWIYTLHREEMLEDWTDVSCPGRLKLLHTEISTVVLNDCSDKLCIGGYGKDKKYWQYDSYEGYHASSFFEKDFKTHGLFLTSKHVKVKLKDLMEVK